MLLFKETLPQVNVFSSSILHQGFYKAVSLLCMWKYLERKVNTAVMEKRL
jgi:hypothetical protein